MPRRCDLRCPVCEGRHCRPLPSPGTRSMRSDGLTSSERLGKASCLACGSAFRPPRRKFRRRLDAAYTLNAAPQNSFDMVRHASYAEAIVDMAGSPPRRVLDVGCGNGALLEELGRHWPQALLAGIEPETLPRNQALQRGLRVARQLHSSHRADLVVSVNVIEHTPEPRQFLRSLAHCLEPGGCCVLIWPADRPPSSELLLSDHLFTLPASQVVRLAAQSGLVASDLRLLRAGGFQALRLVHRRLASWGRQSRLSGKSSRAARAVARNRAAYLRRWQALDADLGGRIDPERSLVAFGLGEAAQTLRAYAPAAWSQVEALTADEFFDDQSMGLPVVNLVTLEPARHQVLLAVGPASQPTLRARLDKLGFDCLAWSHVVEDKEVDRDG